MTRRRGFTLVELLVVIAIIGILIALLLPAVQAAREAARRSQCSNNLKQIGLALQTYHDAYQKFPPAWVLSRGGAAPANGNGYAQWGWGALILPFVEQQAMHDQMNVGPVHLEQVAANSLALLQTPLGTYRCPSDVGPALNTDRGLGTPGQDTALNNYVGAMSSWWGDGGGFNGVNPPVGTNEQDERGVFIETQGTRIAEIIDGTSNTIAVGERRWRFKATDGNIRTARAALVFGINGRGDPRAGDQVGTGRAKLNLNFWDAAATNAGDSARLGFSSMHPGGAIFAFCDGSTHFISETIEYGPDTTGDQWSDNRNTNTIYEQLIAIGDGNAVGGGGSGGIP